MSSRHETLLKEIQEQLMSTRLSDRPKTPPVRDFSDQKTSYYKAKIEEQSPLKFQNLEISYESSKLPKYNQETPTFDQYQQGQAKGSSQDIANKLKKEMLKEREIFLLECQNIENKIKYLLEDSSFQKTLKPSI